MSDSDSAGEFGSAKDENFNGSEKSGGDSDSDAPLSKTKSTPKKNKKAVKKGAKKSPEKKGKKGKKAGKSPKKEKTSKVRFSLDPLAGAEPADKDEEEEEYEVEAIVGHREYNGKLVYKIRWKGYDAIHDTWESYESLSCPDLLEMYNTKHNVKIPSRTKKRKAGGKSKRTPKKRRSSLSDESDEEPWEGDGDSEDEYEVEKIVEMRMKKNGTREFLVHWKKWSSDYDTWEPEANLSCPEIIERFMNRVNNAKANDKELRVGRKHTERFTLSTHDSGRRLSKRNNNKQRVSYYDAEGDDE